MYSWLSLCVSRLRLLLASYTFVFKENRASLFPGFLSFHRYPVAHVVYRDTELSGGVVTPTHAPSATPLPWPRRQKAFAKYTPSTRAAHSLSMCPSHHDPALISATAKPAVDANRQMTSITVPRQQRLRTTPCAAMKQSFNIRAADKATLLRRSFAHSNAGNNADLVESFSARVGTKVCENVILS